MVIARGWRLRSRPCSGCRSLARCDPAHRYGVAVVKAADGGVDHTLLTTLIDRQGTMRVQYLGYRFDKEEFRRDLESLVNEP